MTFSILTGLFVVLIGLQFKAPQKDWVSILKGDAYEDLSEKNNPLYDRKIEQYIAKHRSLYEWFRNFLNLDEERLAQRLDQAGWTRFTPQELIAIRIGALILGVGFTVLTPFVFHSALGVLLGVLATFVAYFYPEMKIKDMIARRQKEVRRNLPDFLDLLVSLLDVGTPIQDAILQISDSMNDTTSKEFRRAAIEAKYEGGQWTSALDRMANRLQVTELSDLISAIILAHHKGTPLAPVLREQTARLRYHQQQEYEERAAKMGVKMLPILMIFIFIPMMILLIVPAFSQL